MAKLLTDLFFTALDNSGDTLSGAKLNFYATGTSTRQDTFADSALSGGNELSNPVVANSAGRFPAIYLQPLAYKVVFTDADDVVIMTIDPVNGAVSSELVLVEGSTTARSMSDRFGEVANVKDYGAVGDGATDDLAAFNLARDAAVTDGHKVIYVPGSSTNYMLSAQFSLSTAGLVLMGDGQENSKLEFTVAVGEVYLAEARQQVRNLAVNSNYLSDYCIRTNPATDAQRGGHLIENVWAEKAEKVCIQINERSDGTTLRSCTASRPGNRDATGLPITHLAHGVETKSECKFIDLVSAGATGFNLKVSGRRCSFGGIGRLNFGWLGNLWAKEGTQFNASNRASTIMLTNVFMENPGLSQSGATTTNNNAHSVLADGPTVNVTLTALHKLLPRKVTHAILAINGAKVAYNGPFPTYATYAPAVNGTHLFSTAKEVLSSATGSITAATNTLTLDEPSIFEDGDRIRVIAAGATASDPLDTYITSGGGTVNLVLNDNAGTTATDKACWLLSPTEERTAAETGSIDVGVSTTTLNLSAIGDWHKGDPIIIVGAGAAAADLTTRIVAGQGTTAVTIADVASTTVASAVLKKPAKDVGTIRYRDLSQMRDLNIASSEWTGLHKAAPADRLTIIPEDMQHVARLLDGITLHPKVTNTIQTNGVTTATETTEILTGGSSMKITGDGSTSTANNANFNFSTVGLKGSWVLVVAVIKREQVGADAELNTALRVTTATTQALALQSDGLCTNETTVLGAGVKGDWLTYQCTAYVAEENDVKVQLVLDADASRTSDDIIYVDSVDLFAVDPVKTAQIPGNIPRLPSYTVATLPAVATHEQAQIWVSDETGGATMAISDGTNWRRMQDYAIVS